MEYTGIQKQVKEKPNAIFNGEIMQRSHVIEFSSGHMLGDLQVRALGVYFCRNKHNTIKDKKCSLLVFVYVIHHP